MEKQNNNGGNGAKLDHHLEHLIEFRAHIQLQKFIQQD